ncbi:AMP-binding protein [Bradyrhizobium jicamae]|uniref:AMP-binding protein n=1 Tax=Bradyrhizobium jicamae TaxID=280332 RepID=UPI001BAA3EA7|nr:AMP-binding protein [Bradyrhizobium jicamae]MBR0938779.1 AMP-binding protein [Bradyrhizobium jicamae]
MVGRLIQTAKSAYQYPLIFKQLWHTPRVQAPDQEVVYRDPKRFTYRQTRERIGRLASALSRAGVEPGDTVGVLEWDSHRFLEAFFAIPMMAAVLQTVNVRLSPEQIAFTIDHAGASTLLVNDEFVGLLEGITVSATLRSRTISRRSPTRAPSRSTGFRRRSSSSTTFPRRASARSTRRSCASSTATCSCPNGTANRPGRTSWATSPLPD